MRGALRERFGGLPRSYWVLWGGTLINRLGTMVQPFFAFYLTGSRGLSLAQVGAVLTVFGAGAFFSQLLSGHLADRYGRRITLTGGMLATAVIMLVLAYSQNIAVIVACMFLLGVAMEIYRPASSALVGDIIPTKDRTRAFALLFWAVNLGFTGGVLTGGLLAESAILWLFWIDAVSCVVFGLLVWFLVPASQEAPRADVPGSFRDVARDRVMMVFVAITLAYAVVYHQSMITLPLAMRADGLDPTAYGIALAANGVVIVLVQPLVVNWLGKFDHSTVAAVGMAVVGLGFGLTMFVSSTAGYTATVVVWSIGEIVVTGVSAAIATNLAPPHLRGRYMGVYGFAFSLSNLISPVFGTWLLGIGQAVLWSTLAALSVVATVAQLWIAPAIRERTLVSVA
ncbi:MFS transporter [Actinokineospora sp. UTMC 2448]|uniref:MDR family MFS transporter n=1 Tax=Actinokineospora sp. UTMC 2448 TaxID=2268449 RepID=UPI0021646A7D|nr:MFS transporter [Actinokineospora sp. UTMC 2448]UVS77638.1 Multidrug resistance protein MdtH [Actinokineospora sp. UTMC 2448]